MGIAAAQRGRQDGVVRRGPYEPPPGAGALSEDQGLEAEELRTAKAAIEELLDERRRLLDLVVRLPGLLAERESADLVAGVAEACRELTGARFALYVPADGDA